MNTLPLFYKSLVLFACFAIVNTLSLSAQMDDKSDFSYQINRVQKYVSISADHLAEATTLKDLNHYYKSDWVKEYKLVEITTIHNGVSKSIMSKDNMLTTEQKNAISTADRGSDIDVLVKYLPDNNLSGNKVQEMDFTFRIDPNVEATYAGSESELKQYVTRNILDKVTIEDIPQYQVAAVKFTIDEEGRVVDAFIAQASKSKKSDEIMLKTVCDMPSWNSAAYADGTKTKQDFVLTIGDHYSCTMNLLDIKSDVPPITLQDR